MNSVYMSFSAEHQMTGNTLKGYAHIYGMRALVNGQYEVMKHGVFDTALQTSDVRAFYQHDRRLLLGRQSSGTLRLNGQGKGLEYELDLPATTLGNDIRVLLERGDLREMSFGFIPGKVAFMKADDGARMRVHLEAKQLVDISPVSIPAFEGTSIELRDMQDEEGIKSQLIRARHRTLIKEFDREWK